MTKSKAVGSPSAVLQDAQFQQARATVLRTIDRLKGCSDEERGHLQREINQLHEMLEKLTRGQVEIVIFGEISTGKSALINALVGDAIAAVDVQGGWTKEVWHVPWSGSGYCIPGLAESAVVLVDTPGLNEVGGDARGEMAREAAERADIVLFVSDSDLNEIEFTALTTLAAQHKPLLVVLNKMDLYTPEQRRRLLEVVRNERLRDILPAENVIPASADPREVEYIVESADGSSRSEWRKPAPDVEAVKVKILEVLEREGLALLALNAAMYAADRSDRIAALRVRLRDRWANQTIWSCAVLKATAVALNPIAVADVLGGSAVDISMVVTLAHIYGLELSWKPAKQLVGSIFQAAGWVMLGEALTHFAASSVKLLTVGTGTVLTALPQSAAAGYGSYVVGQAAKYYFEHGASWGGEAPKTVVHRILDETDKASVIAHLKGEIKKKLSKNPHARPEKKS